MSVIKVDYGNSGGKAEFIDATISGTNFTCSWNYNAEVVIFSGVFDGASMIFMYDLATKDSYYCSPTSVWTHQGVDSRVTTSPTSISGSYGTSISNMSVIPITNKPQGYFT